MSSIRFIFSPCQFESIQNDFTTPFSHIELPASINTVRGRQKLFLKAVQTSEGEYHAQIITREIITYHTISQQVIISSTMITMFTTFSGRTSNVLLLFFVEVERKFCKQLQYFSVCLSNFRFSS